MLEASNNARLVRGSIRKAHHTSDAGYGTMCSGTMDGRDSVAELARFLDGDRAAGRNMVRQLFCGFRATLDTLAHGLAYNES
jgi:hypothetical protein